MQPVFFRRNRVFRVYLGGKLFHEFLGDPDEDGNLRSRPAQDSKGNVVGEPRAGGDVNPATRTLTLIAGQRKQIALKMDDEFRGKFSVKALNPTTLALASNGSELALETDYTE